MLFEHPNLANIAVADGPIAASPMAGFQGLIALLTP